VIPISCPTVHIPARCIRIQFLLMLLPRDTVPICDSDISGHSNCHQSAVATKWPNPGVLADDNSASHMAISSNVVVFIVKVQGHNRSLESFSPPDATMI
jgi:hypothetical protein